MSTRRCLACELVTNELLCPNDGLATLNTGLPLVDPQSIVPGRIIADRYRIESSIGSGGFGVVFAAHRIGSWTPVAVKVLTATSYEDPTLLLRFFQEAKVTAALVHPNTVRVVDFGQDAAGVLFIVMERLYGRSLREEYFERKSRQELFSEAEASWIATEILSSLEEAHAVGLVHRDLKPDNIFLHQEGSSTVVKVLDFGVAKLRDADLTGASMVPCTPEFASPEMALGRPVDGRSDLYMLGINLYLLVSGQLPFAARERIELLKLHAKSPPRSLRSLSAVHLSDGFIRIIERALEKDPRARFADALEMKSELSAFLSVRGDSATHLLPRDAASPELEPPTDAADITATEVTAPGWTQSGTVTTPARGRAAPPLETLASDAGHLGRWQSEPKIPQRTARWMLAASLVIFALGIALLAGAMRERRRPVPALEAAPVAPAMNRPPSAVAPPERAPVESPSSGTTPPERPPRDAHPTPVPAIPKRPTSKPEPSETPSVLDVEI